MSRPHWAARFIGIPYKEGGESFHGCDCIGLVRLVYEHEFANPLPPYPGPTWHGGGRSERRAIHEAALAFASQFQRVYDDDVKAGDVVLFAVGGAEMHAGICLGNGEFLHVEDNSTSGIDRLDGLIWRSRGRTYWRANDSAAPPRIEERRTSVTA